MMKRNLVFIYIMCVAVAASYAGNVVFKAKLDSTTLLMGCQTLLHVEVSQDKNVEGILIEENADTLNAFVEIVGKSTPDTIDIENQRVQIKRDLVLQSFDSGVYVLPPLRYVVGKDTFRTQSLSLKVIPVNIDTLKTVHDFKYVEEVPFKLFDWVPSFISDYWWVYLIVILVIAIGLFVYFKWLRHGQIPLLPKKKRLPPYEEAMQRLADLKEKHLWQSGQEKAYFTEITDILREYIERRFEVNAVEMTTSQIMEALRKNEVSRPVNQQLGSVLELADFVKFANLRPLPDENEMAYQRTLTYLNETKPVEVVEETEDSESQQTESDQKDKEVKK